MPASSGAEGPHCNTALRTIKPYPKAPLLDSKKAPKYALRLPGEGEITYPRIGELSKRYCDEYQYTLACVAKGPEHRAESKRPVHWHCHKITCPSCYQAVAMNQARRIEERLVKLAIAYKAKGVKLGPKPKHFELSVPPQRITESYLAADGGKAFHAELQQVLASSTKNGFHAEVAILHAWRKKHLDGSECGRKSCRQQHQMVWGPHFHLIGYGYMDDQNTFDQKNPGWHYKQIADKGERDIKATAYYLLTHQMVPVLLSSGRAGKTYRYGGLFQDKRARAVKQPSRTETVPCELCKAPMHKFAGIIIEGELVHDDAFETDQGEHTITVKVTDYVLLPSKANQLRFKTSMEKS